ncbi:MAG: glutamine--tRNA ligase, partial [Candidatus Atribacteria bacterium]|nr:glutamine--tRNA ligase [Candidatus Atribacteria bacterium]
EFEDHRPLYDWFLKQLDVYHPRQIEFARLNLNNTIMSKRKLRKLVEEGYISGWDDPRIPTLSGLRRRGYTPEAIRSFCEQIGISKSNSIVDVRFLEHCIREDLNMRAPRVMGVLKPLKLVIKNYPENMIENLDAENNPENPNAGTHKMPFSKNLYIEREDFCEDPPRKYFRLTPGREVRLKNAYIIKCEGFLKDEKTGEVKEVYCTYDPESKSGRPGAKRKVKGTLHWVSADHALSAEVRLYDHLLLDQNEETDTQEEGEDFIRRLNPKSLEVLKDCLVEPVLSKATSGNRYQFMRKGYFSLDVDSTNDKLVFNRIVSLRDSWAKILKANKEKK